MSGSVFLSGGWLVGPGVGGIVDSAGRRAGAVRNRVAPGGRRRRGTAAEAGGMVAILLSMAGIQSRFQQVDYRNFRELLNVAISGHVRNWGRDTYLYDSRNRLVAIKRAARFESNGRSTPTRYFVRRSA